MNHFLAEYATKPENSRGRAYAIDESEFHNVFQEDVLRIARSTAFRRLAHKTQVFINDDQTGNDHHRTRLTHSIEVSVIGKIIARNLNLSSDLTEALCLVHDLGHPPFGHAGERVLNKLIKEEGGFNHNIYTFQLITELEEKYLKYNGLNLTLETIEGIVKHNGPITSPDPLYVPIFDYSKKFDLQLSKQPSLEAQVASIADDIAYNAHDIEDALRAGMFKITDLNGLLGPEILIPLPDDKHKNQQAHELAKLLIEVLMRDVINNTKDLVAKHKIKSLEDVQNSSGLLVGFSDKYASIMKNLSAFLFEKVYKSPQVVKVLDKQTKILEDLFHFYKKDLSELPTEWQAKSKTSGSNANKVIVEYIAGMTDKFAINTHKSIFSQNSF